MTHRHGNIHAELPTAAPDEVVDDLVRTEGARFERIVSTGQATPEGEWYDQGWDEFVILLTGEAGLAFEATGETHTLTPGHWHVIPAHCRHRVAWTSHDPPAVWLAVHLGPATG